MHKKYGGAVFISVCILAVYVQTLDFQFLNLDDPIHLSSNPYLNGQAPFLDLWKIPYKRLYIPVTYSVWGAIYALTRSAWAFHLLNFTLHIVTSAFLVFPLIRRSYGGRAAMLGALFSPSTPFK